MNNYAIPLPTAVPDKEYIIQYIINEKTNFKKYFGYGIFPGSKIKLLFRSPSKNPSAYEIMGAVLALRHEDSENIYVLPYTENSESTC